jgi:hypothetical protein
VDQNWIAQSQQLTSQYGTAPAGFDLGKNTANFDGGSMPKATATPNDFIGNIAHSVGNVAQQAAGGIYHSFMDPIQGLGHNLASVYDAHNDTNFIDNQRGQLDQAMKSITSQRATMRPENYQKALKILGEGYQQLNDHIKSNSEQMHLPTTGEFAKNELGVIGDAASFGKLALGGKVAEAAAAGNTGAKVVQGAEKVLQAGSSAPSGAVASVLKAPIKNVLMNQPVAQAPVQFAHDVKTGNTGDALLQAGTAVAGPVTGFVAPKVLDFAKGLFRSDQGFVNTLKFKDGTIQSVLSNLQSKAASGDAIAAKQYSTLSDQAKVAFDHMNAEGRTPTQIAQYEAAHSNPTEGRTVQDWLQTQHDMATAHGIVQANADKFMVNAKGEPVPAKMKAQLGVGKFDQSEKAGLIQRLSAVSTPAERGAIIAADQKAGVAYTQNSNVMKAVQNAAIESDPGLMAKGIHDIQGTHALTIGKAGVATADDASMHAKYPDIFKSPDEIANDMPKLPGGYIPIIRPAAAAGFKQAGEVSNDVLKAGHGILGGVTDSMRKAGLGLGATDQAAVHAQLTQNLASELSDRGIKGDAGLISSALRKAADDVRGVSDARGLTKNQIEGALVKVAPEANPGEVRKAYAAAVAALPKEQVGLGPSLVNKTLGKSVLFQTYQKAQTVGRYQLNPVFWAKQDIKGGLVAMVEGATPGIRGTEADRLALKGAGLLDERGRSGGDVVGSPLDIGTPSSTSDGKLMRRDQQAIVTWLGTSIAKSNGTTVAKILEEGGPLASQMKESLSLVHSYGTGDYLNSPFAKSMNLLIFPSRFATKVGIEATKVITKMNPVAQAALVHNLATGIQWTKSDTGKQWQKDNSELLGVIKYMTPVSEIEGVAKFFDSGFHVGDLGQIGGLPIGVISTILNHQGWLPDHLGSSPYVNPKTGQLVPNKLPSTSTSRIQTGLTDLIGSMFGYPGRTVGLPSKTDVIQGASGGLLKPAKGSMVTQPTPGASAQSATPGKSITPGPTTYTTMPKPSVTLTPTISGARRIRAGRAKSLPASMQIKP